MSKKIGTGKHQACHPWGTMAISSTNTSFRRSYYHKTRIIIIYSKLHKCLWNIYNIVYQIYHLDQWSHPERVALRESWFFPRVDGNWLLHSLSENSRQSLCSWEEVNATPYFWWKRLLSHISILQSGLCGFYSS
jgi:hypothetical protein